MIEAVITLGEWNTLEAITPLARYDRNAKGWIAIIVSCLPILLANAMLITFIIWLFLNTVLYAMTCVLLGALALSNDRVRQRLIDFTRALRREVELRVLLLRSIESQRQRNRAAVGGDWRRAVCRRCLARFELYRVRFAYLRWLSFARCRKCHMDHECYTRVRRIEGWLDREMAPSQEQIGEVVKVNMLQRFPPFSLPLPFALDELVVSEVEDMDVETFIFFYRKKQPKTNLPPAKQLRCRLSSTSTLSPLSNGLRQLKAEFLLRDRCR